MSRRLLVGVVAVLAAVALTSAAAQRASTATPGLVAAYAFSEGSGTTVADLSGNGNTGTIVGATWTTAGKYGNALTFNGTSARVDVPDAASLHLSSGMTLEAWVKPNSQTGWKDVVYKGNDNYYLEGVSSSGSPAGGGTFGGANANVFGSGALAAGTWVHVAVTYDGSNLRFYVNGTLTNTQAATGAITSSPNPLEIGGDTFYSKQFFNGTIDEIRVYNAALTAAQIQTDMTTPIDTGGTDTQPPGQPGTLTATPISSSQINLSWGAASDNTGVTGYDVERCQNASCSSFAQIGTAPGTTYSDGGLLAGTSYSYRVRAFDAAQNLGPYSNTATTTTNAAGTSPTLEAAYAFSEGSGSTVADLSGNGNTGTVVGATWTTVGKYGNALNFSGSSQRVDVPDSASLHLTSGMTLEAWVNPTASSTAWKDVIYKGNDNYYLEGSSSNAGVPAGGGTFGGSNGNAFGTGAVAANVWTHLALTYDGSTLRLYVNGTLVGSQAKTGAITTSTNPLSIGGDSIFGQYFKGSIDEVRIYNGALSATAIQSDMSTPIDSGGGGTDTQPPSAPGTVTATANGTSEIDLGWGAATDNTAVTGYRIERCQNASCSNFAQIAQVGAVLTYADTGLAPGTSYTYRVHAVDGAGNVGNFSNNATATTATSTGSPSLVAAYNFNEGSGTTVADSSGNGNNGTVMNTTWTTAGKMGGALVFNGTSSRVNVPDSASLHLTSGMTLEAWVNPASSGTKWTDVIYKGSDNYYLEGSSSNAGVPAGGGTFAGTSANVFGTSTITPGSWTHLALTYDGATLRFYVNGVLASSKAQTGAIATSTNQLQIGGDSTFGQYFNGTIDEVRIYNTALTAAQIQADMGSSLTISPRQVALTPGETQTYTATATVTWSVDGVAGGNATVGTITSGGVYTAPSAAGTHTITATAGSQTVNATAYISNYPGVYTYHYDNMRTGLNSNETVLTPSNVNSGSFGKLFSRQLDGLTFASPLYVENVTIPGQGVHNVVYIATEHDSVYAFDADGKTSTPLWKDSFINPSAGINPIPPSLTGETKDIPNEIGITGTPVIDPSTKTMYVVAATDENGTLVNRLHALDMTTGAEKTGSPVVINPSVPGTGVDSQNGTIKFNNTTENQRAALTFANGELYVAFANHGFNPPYHGWVLAFNPSSLHQDWVYCTTPNAQSGGVWMGGDGIGVDASGNLFFSTGNGTFDQNSGGGDYGDTLVKLNSSGAVADYFTPYNYQSLDSGDVDLASGGLILLPDQSGAHPHEILAAGKGGTIYVVNRDSMGHVGSGSDSQIIQSLINVFPTGGSFNTGNYSSPVYFNGAVFYAPVMSALMRFSVTNGLLSTSPTSQSPEVYNGKTSTFSARGGQISASSNGTSNGILWALQSNGDTTPGTLHAYNPANLTQEYYTSDQAGTRDQLDPWLKFTTPTVANGHVYVVSAGNLTAYGLLP